MTKLFEMALTKAAQLADAEQDRIPQLMLDEIEDVTRWQATSAGSRDKLAALAQCARREIARECKTLTPAPINLCSKARS